MWRFLIFLAVSLVYYHDDKDPKVKEEFKEAKYKPYY
jgi:hypothetical protein